MKKWEQDEQFAEQRAMQKGRRERAAYLKARIKKRQAEQQPRKPLVTPLPILVKKPD